MSLFQKTIIKWYTTNKRDLPWRATNDPYKIWLSEIILQQTRVAQGTDYYLRFIANFPDIQKLASAPEDEILKLWQGLGYYSRARNLHATAKEICLKHNGTFPTHHNEIIQLKGIGTYTASAISSFAYNEPFAVVDGNVYRVLSRFFDIDAPIDSTAGKKVFEKLANDLLPAHHSSEYNQAIMEFGALQCTPAHPDCDICPLSTICIALKNNTVTKLPVKEKKTKVSERYFNYLYITNKDKTYLQKRTGNDIWKNLYELPLIEADRLLDVEDLADNTSFRSLFDAQNEVKISGSYKDFRHVLSHRIIYARFFSIDTCAVNLTTNLQEILVDNIGNFAVARLSEMFFEEKGII